MNRLLALSAGLLLVFGLAAPAIAAGPSNAEMAVTISLSPTTPIPGPPLQIDVVRVGGNARSAQEIRVDVVMSHLPEYETDFNLAVVWDNGKRVTGHVTLDVLHGWYAPDPDHPLPYDSMIASAFGTGVTSNTLSIDLN